jgi:hypothetical protein
MNTAEPGHGPLQILLVGFETTERFQGEIVRELLDLRGRGMIRVLDARFLHRAREGGKLTEVDLGPLIAERPRTPTRSPGCWASTATAATAGWRRRRRSRGRPASRWRTCAG